MRPLAAYDILFYFILLFFFRKLNTSTTYLSWSMTALTNRVPWKWYGDFCPGLKRTEIFSLGLYELWAVTWVVKLPFHRDHTERPWDVKGQDPPQLFPLRYWGYVYIHVRSSTWIQVSAGCYQVIESMEHGSRNCPYNPAQLLDSQNHCFESSDFWGSLLHSN